MADTKVPAKQPEKFPKHRVPDTSTLHQFNKAWHKVAAIRSWLGETHASIAKSFNRSPATVSSVLKAPAAKNIKAYLDEHYSDPVALAKELAKANALDVTGDWYLALEWAKEARDYEAVAKMTKDLAALGGVQAQAPKQEVETHKTVRIVLDTDTLDAGIVEADWEEVHTEEDDDDL